MPILRRISNLIVSHYWVYNLVQRVAGFEKVAAEVRPLMLKTAGRTVLDVGGGTGLWRDVLPPDAKYVCLDNDPEKLRGLRKRLPDVDAVLTDATTMQFIHQSIDYAMCIFVAHHLDDEQLQHVLEGLAPVLRSELLFVEPLRWPSVVSKLLWAADRGSHPRTDKQLLDQIGQRFDVVESRRFKVMHRYIICVAKPKGVGPVGTNAPVTAVDK